MILIIILAIILIGLIIVAGTTIAIGGPIFIIVFGDVIVCGIFMVWLIKRLYNRRR